MPTKPKNHRSKNTVALGLLIRQRRREAGKSQKLVCWQADWTQSALSALEAGRYGMPGLDKLLKLRQTLGLSLDELLSAAGYDLDVDRPRGQAIEDAWTEVGPNSETADVVGGSRG